MNGLLIIKNDFSIEMRDLITKNGISSLKVVRDIKLIESGLVLNQKNIVFYEWGSDVSEETANLQSILKLSKKYNIKILLLVDEGIKDAIKVLIENENVRFIFAPLTKTKLQIGLRMVIAEKKEVPKVNIEYINPFIESTISIMKDMAFTDLTKKSVQIEKGQKMHGDISGIMSLSGEANGFVVISMDADTSFELVKKMTMGDVKEEETDIIDGGVMELINVISGTSQAAFNQNKFHFDFTTPTMIKGKGHTVNHGIKANSIVVTFETPEKKEIYLQVCIKN